jgi:hypothetical protein
VDIHSSGNQIKGVSSGITRASVTPGLQPKSILKIYLCRWERPSSNGNCRGLGATDRVKQSILAFLLRAAGVGGDRLVIPLVGIRL